MLQGVNTTGLDEEILKSLPADVVSEDLIKAMNKQGLVQKEVQVKGKNGQTFTRKMWVKASEEQSTQQPTKQEEPSDKKEKSKDDVDKKWLDKLDAGNFSKEAKDALSYGVKQRHSCLMEKDGKYTTAKNWDEADYGEEKGWNNLGSITDIINAGSLDKNSDNKNAKSEESSNKISVGDKVVFTNNYSKLGEFTVKKLNKNGEVSQVWSDEKNMGFDVHDQSTIKPVSTSDTDKGTSVSIPDGFFTTKSGNPKNSVLDLLKSGVSRDTLMEEAKKQGIEWKHNDHEGINWMRCSMAIQKHLGNTQGDVNKDDTNKEQASKSEPKKENLSKSGDDGHGGKYYTGSLKGKSDKDIIDKIGRYKYHATTKGALKSIATEGLKPSKGHIGDAVYFGHSQQGAIDATQDSTGGTEIVRVKSPALVNKYNYGDIDDYEGTAEDATIAPEDIEIGKSGTNYFVPANQYAKQDGFHFSSSIYTALTGVGTRAILKQMVKEMSRMGTSEKKKAETEFRYIADYEMGLDDVEIDEFLETY